MKKVVCFVLIVSLGVYLYKMRAEVIGIASVMGYTAAFSLLLTPICKRMEGLGMHTMWAAGMAVIGLFLLVLVMLAAFIPNLVVRMFYLLKRIAPAATDAIQTCKLWMENSAFIQGTLTDAGAILGTSLGTITGKLAKAGMMAAAQLGRIGFSLVLTYYVLCDRRRIVNHLLLFVAPAWRTPVLSGIRACRNAMMSYFSGLLKTSIFVSAATCIGLMLLGVQDALLLSVLMGFLEILPYLGPVLAAIPILLSAMMRSGETAWMAFVLIIIVQQIEGNIISPYFTASNTSVHPLTALVAVFVLGSLLGVWGVLFAVPLLVLVKCIFWSWTQTRCTMRVTV